MTTPPPTNFNSDPFSPSAFDCPHCGHHVPDPYQHEMSTVASWKPVIGTGHPHIICPNCKQCTGCVQNDRL